MSRESQIPFIRGDDVETLQLLDFPTPTLSRSHPIHPRLMGNQQRQSIMGSDEPNNTTARRE